MYKCNESTMGADASVKLHNIKTLAIAHDIMIVAANPGKEQEMIGHDCCWKRCQKYKV